MRKFVLFVILSVFLIPSVHAQGISLGDIQIIPIIPSVNESFVIIVDGESWITDSTRVSWFIPEAEAALPGSGFGSFPNVDNKFICYFSGLTAPDPMNTCGPTPFRNVETYQILINTTNFFGTPEGVQLNRTISSIKFDHTITVDNGTIFMTIKPSELSDQVLYTVYNSNNWTPITSLINKPLEEGLFNQFIGNVSLGPGDYGIEFVAIAPPFGSGGMIVTVNIPEDLPTCSDGMQNGGETGVDCGGDCPLCGGGPDGSFDAKIISDKAEADVVIKKGLDLAISFPSFQVTNIDTAALSGLKTVIPSNLTSILNVTLANATLQANETMFFSIDLFDVQEGMEIITKVDIFSGVVKVGEIPIDLRVSVLVGDSDVVVVQGGDLSISPVLWEAEEVVSQTTSKSFSLFNLGNTTITDIVFTTEVSGINATLPSSIPSGSSATMHLSLKKSAPGNYCCLFTINSSGGMQTGLVNINFFPNVSSGIVTLGSEISVLRTELSGLLTLDQMNAVENGIISNIESLLTSANSDFAIGNFENAQKKTADAQSRINTLKSVKILLTGITVTPGPGPGPTPSPQPSGDFDSTMIIIIVVVIIVAVVTLFFFKMRKPGQGGEEYEEEFQYDEERPPEDDEEL